MDDLLSSPNPNSSQDNSIPAWLAFPLPTPMSNHTFFKSRAVGFEVEAVTRGGKPEDYMIDWIPRGRRVYMGREDITRPRAR